MTNNNDSIINEYTLHIQEAKNIGIRLDKFLADSLPFSRTLIQKWLIEGYVSVNDNVQITKYKTKIGDIINIQAPSSPQELSFRAQEMELDILFEDRHLCILNKPAGLVTHPGPGNWQGTLLNGLLYNFPGSQEIPRAGIIHRLDKMTSGLMVVAKTLQAQNQLVEAMQRRDIKRQYLAIVQGNTWLKGTIDEPIGRHPIYKTRMAVSKKGKPAKTHYKKIANLPISNNQSKTLIECTLESGRTHQIRVHMAHIGHNLLGDGVYSNDKTSTFAPTQRQALHAVRLSFIHPITNEYLNFFTEPDDELMVEALNEFELTMATNLYSPYMDNHEE